MDHSSVGGVWSRAGDSFHAMVSHVASEYHWLKLYVQKDDELIQHIAHYLEGVEPALSSKPGFMHQSQLPLGTPCFARFTDGKWYRAVVSAWPRSDDTLVEVTFIDYGNLEIVSVADVRQGQDHIFRTPPVACECFLDELDLGLVSPAVAERLVGLAKATLQHKKVNVTVRRLECVQVNIVRPLVSIMCGGKNIADVLLRSTPAAAAAAVPKEPLTFHYPSVKLGVPCRVYVAHAENMNRVFVHLATRDPMPYSDMIQERCANAAPLDPLRVKVGTVCLALFTEDSMLYRSVVLECAGGACNVLFVDYGNCEVKSTNELLAIPLELLEEPAFALPCSAPGTGLDCATFLEVTKDRELMCTFSKAQTSGAYVAEFEGLNCNMPQPTAALGLCGTAPTKAAHHIQIQRLRLDPGCRHVMYITYIESAEVMYGQLKEMVSDIEQISAQLEEESPSLAMVSVTDIEPGSAVACRYQHIWYRAEVIKPGPHTEVWIADYGDTTTVDISELRQLDLKYTLQPAYATKLTLDGFTCPPQISDQLMAKLEKLVLDTEVSVSIVTALPDNTHTVQIFVGDPPKSVVRALQSTIANTQPTSTVKAQSPTVCPVEKVLVTNVTPPSSFFGQFVRIPVEELDAFQQKLMDHYSVMAPDPAFRPQIGDHICCRFSEDKGFYRARVEKVSANGSQYDVYYLDYGNSETVSSEAMRPLEPQFAVPPLFGIPCQLHSGEVSVDLVDKEIDVRLLACHGEVHSVAFGGSAHSRSKGPSTVVTTTQASPTGDMNAFGSVPSSSAAALTLFGLRLDPGSQELAVTVFVKSVSEFYCQLLRNEGHLKGVSDILESVASSLPVLPPNMRKVGTACCALYSEDGCWYRGIIQAVQTGSAAVFFVDYGNSETVSDASLKLLPESLALVPRQAVACRLKGAAPTNAVSAGTRLDDIVAEQEVTLVIHGCSPEEVHDVDVVLSNGLNVLDQLIEEGLVIPAGGRVSPMAPVASSQPRHVGGYQYPTLMEGVAVLVEVPWVLSAGEVYVKLVETSTALDNLMAELQSYYSNPSVAVGNDVRPGQACVALYSDDGSWYRARVTHSKGGMLGVQYVDYGNCEEVSASSVQPILPKFAQLPAQAIRCRLRSVAPPGGGSMWPPAAPEGALQHAFEGQFLCRPSAHRDGVHLVDLERPTGTPGPSLVETLVAAGLAMDATTMPRDLGSTSEASQGQRQLRAVIAPAEFAFQTRQFVDVKVTAVMSPSEVWCCLVENVEPLAKALQEAGDVAPKFRNPVPGEACIARLHSANQEEDGDKCLALWARAVVRSRPSPAKLELFFVDMGGTRVVHHTEVKQIPPELTMQPGCAFQCALDCNFPIDVAELSAKILHKDLVLQVEQQLEPAKVIGSLFDTSGEDEMNVLDCFAPPSPPPLAAEPPASDVKPVQESEPIVEAGVTENETAPPVIELESIVPGIISEKPEVTAMKPEVSAAKPSTPPARTSPPGRSAQPHFRWGQIVPCYPPLSKISGKMLALVMHVEDLSCFYIMRKDQESGLDDLSRRLHTHYEEMPEPIVEPLPRLPCVALYSNDNVWYRAKVVPDGSCVQFIDYGNTDIVHEIRAIAAEFLEVPPFCYKCKLAGAKDLADISGVVDEFISLVLDKTVEVEVVTWGPEVTVRLCADGEDINTTLQKFASSKTSESFELAETEASAVVAVNCEAGVVSHIEALNSFYVQFSARLDDLDVFGDKLQEALASGTATAVETPDSDTLYAALYTEDDLWYRARVEGTGENGSGFRVRFVDYGIAQTVKSVLPLDSEDLQVEPFCVRCQLFGVNTADSASALEKFKELVYASDLFVEIVAPGNPMTVKLFTPDGTDLLCQLPLPKSYRTIEVPLHQKVVVQISHVESATDFYVNLSDHLDALESLAQQLLDVPLSGNTPTDTSLPCMVYWIDDLPYRVTILKDEVGCTGEGPALARVKFVDYGNTVTVDRATIYPLPDGMVDIPVFAINCTLDVPEGKLGKEATEELQLLAESRSGTSLLAEFLEQKDSRYVVRILDMGIDVLETLVQRTAQDASREDTSILIGSGVQSGLVLVEPSETPKAPSEVADIHGARSANTDCINRDSLNSTAFTAENGCAVDNDAEGGEETLAIKEHGLHQYEKPAELAKALTSEEATEPAIKVEQSELKEVATAISSSAIALEDMARNETLYEKTDSSDKDQAGLFKEDGLLVVTEADTRAKEQDCAAGLRAVSEDCVHSIETRDRAANLLEVSKVDVLPEEPGLDEACFSVRIEECTLSDDVCEAAVYEDSLSEENLVNGVIDSLLQDTAGVTAAEGGILCAVARDVTAVTEVSEEGPGFEKDAQIPMDETAGDNGADDSLDSAAYNTSSEDTAGLAAPEAASPCAKTQHVTAATGISEESTGVKKDAQKSVGETAGNKALEVKSPARQMDTSIADTHALATSSVGPFTTASLNEETTAPERQAAVSTGCGGTPQESSALTSEAGDAPSLMQRAGADDSSATGAVAISDFGADSDIKFAVAASSPTTQIRHSAGKISLDDRPIPGVCTNAELLGAPSDT